MKHRLSLLAVLLLPLAACARGDATPAGAAGAVAAQAGATAQDPRVALSAKVPGFFWLAGQGGYGIQSAAGSSALADALLRDAPLPEALRQHGVDPAASAPTRLR